MSQKKQTAADHEKNGVDPADKWREMAEQEASFGVEKEELPIE